MHNEKARAELCDFDINKIKDQEKLENLFESINNQTDKSSLEFSLNESSDGNNSDENTLSFDLQF